MTSYFGDEKVTLNHLVVVWVFCFGELFHKPWNKDPVFINHCNFGHAFLAVFCFFSLPQKLTGLCSTPNQLLICSSFSRENSHPLLICSSSSTSQLRVNRIFLRITNSPAFDGWFFPSPFGSGRVSLTARRTLKSADSISPQHGDVPGRRWTDQWWSDQWVVSTILINGSLSQWTLKKKVWTLFSLLNM